LAQQTISQCIHGVPTDQCVSCRVCHHGLTVSSCPRCRSAATARKAVEPTGDRETHTHGGYDIFYDPAVSGWRYRASDAAASTLSYRSAFLARKAVDALGSSDKKATSGSKRRSS
jgi:hypothetical protein